MATVTRCRLAVVDQVHRFCSLVTTSLVRRLSATSSKPLSTSPAERPNTSQSTEEELHQRAVEAKQRADGDHDRLMREFFQLLQQPQPQSQSPLPLSSSSSQGTQALQAMYSLFAGFATPAQKQGRLVELTAALERPADQSNRWLSQVLGCGHVHDLQNVCRQWVAWTRKPPAVQPQPSLLSAMIAQARRFHDPHLAYWLVRQLRQQGTLTYVAWFDTNVYNELMFLDWQHWEQVQRVRGWLMDMQTHALPFNAFTLFLLQHIRDRVGHIGDPQLMAGWQDLVRELTAAPLCGLSESPQTLSTLLLTFKTAPKLDTDADTHRGSRLAATEHGVSERARMSTPTASSTLAASTDMNSETHCHVGDAHEALLLEREHVHAVYDAIAPHFSLTRHSPWPVIERFLASLPPHSLVADIGCGNGKYLTACSPASAEDGGGHRHRRREGALSMPPLHFVACDRSGALVRLARHRQPQVDVLLGDTVSPPYRTASCDYLLSIAVLHHLANEARRLEAIKQLVRLVRGGGRLLIFVWALEQGPQSRRRLGEDGRQDVLVPWQTTHVAASTTSPGDSVLSTTTTTYQRYYHLFREGELGRLVRRAVGQQVAILTEGYDRDNWYVELQRLPEQ